MSFSSTLPRVGFAQSRRRLEDVPAGRLRVTDAHLAEAIGMAGPAHGLPTMLLKHALTKFRLALMGVNYLCQGEAVREAYRRMTTAEFTHINARQAWANWRIIPRNLHGNLPIDRPLSVIDLCCGMGESIKALTWWLPAGSQVLGIESDPRFAAAAAAATYRNRFGEVIEVTVWRGSVLDGFRDGQGNPVDAQTFDVVHAIGSIACHFTPDQTKALLQECQRVLRQDGFALLDARRTGPASDKLEHFAKNSGFQVMNRSRSWLFDRYEQLVLRHAA